MPRGEMPRLSGSTSTARYFKSTVPHKDASDDAPIVGPNT